MSRILRKPDMTRVDLAHLFAYNGYRQGAEIGVARGDYAYTLCKANPKATVHCIDPWTVYRGYGDCTDWNVMGDNKRKARERLQPFANANIINAFSECAQIRFADDELDFVYIDANHSWPHITYDLYCWAKKVRPGGIVSGHDYLEDDKPGCHVRHVLLAYIVAFDISPLYVIGNPDRAQSWYWVKT